MAMTKDYDPRRDGPKRPVGNRPVPDFLPPMPGKPGEPEMRPLPKPLPIRPGMPNKPSRPMPGKPGEPEMRPLPRPLPIRPGMPMPAPGGGFIGGRGAATPGGFTPESVINARQQAIMSALNRPQKGGSK